MLKLGRTMENQDFHIALVNDTDFRAQMLEKSFSPSVPIRDSDLFAGRKEQRRDISLAVNQAGQHVIVFSERGVGKTSLANILEKQYQNTQDMLAVRINCDSQDTFESLWKKTLEEMEFVSQRIGVGFSAPSMSKNWTLADYIAGPITSNSLRRLFTSRPDKRFVVIFDEFDRLVQPEVPTGGYNAARRDAKGTFAAADVRGPMSKVMGKPYEITAFSQHLNDFSNKKRGDILEKMGPPRKIRFRFRNPLMQTYVILHGLKNGLIKPEDLEKINSQ